MEKQHFDWCVAQGEVLEVTRCTIQHNKVLNGIPLQPLDKPCCSLALDCCYQESYPYCRIIQVCGFLALWIKKGHILKVPAALVQMMVVMTCPPSSYGHNFPDERCTMLMANTATGTLFHLCSRWWSSDNLQRMLVILSGILQKDPISWHTFTYHAHVLQALLKKLLKPSWAWIKSLGLCYVKASASKNAITLACFLRTGMLTGMSPHTCLDTDICKQYSAHIHSSTASNLSLNYSNPVAVIHFSMSAMFLKTM